MLSCGKSFGAMLRCGKSGRVEIPNAIPGHRRFGLILPGIAKIWQKFHGLTWYLQFACNICFYNQRLPPLNILIFVWVEGLDPFAKTAFLLTTRSRQNRNLQAFPCFKPGPRDSKRTREAPRIQMKGNPKTQRRIKSVHKMCLQIVLNVLFTSMERTKCRVKKEQSQRTIV